LGDPKTVILGVDRLDYTKGIELRLDAFGELLEEGTLSVPDTVMARRALQLGVWRARVRGAAESTIGRAGPLFGLTRTELTVRSPVDRDHRGRAGAVWCCALASARYASVAIIDRAHPGLFAGQQRRLQRQRHLVARRSRREATMP
jgi:hypothetical protein